LLATAEEIEDELVVFVEATDVRFAAPAEDEDTDTLVMIGASAGAVRLALPAADEVVGTASVEVGGSLLVEELADGVAGVALVLVDDPSEVVDKTSLEDAAVDEASVTLGNATTSSDDDDGTTSVEAEDSRAAADEEVEESPLVVDDSVLMVDVAETATGTVCSSCATVVATLVDEEVAVVETLAESETKILVLSEAKSRLLLMMC